MSDFFFSFLNILLICLSKSGLTSPTIIISMKFCVFFIYNMTRVVHVLQQVVPILMWCPFSPSTGTLRMGISYDFGRGGRSDSLHCVNISESQNYSHLFWRQVHINLIKIRTFKNELFDISIFKNNTFCTFEFETNSQLCLFINQKFTG